MSQTGSAQIFEFSHNFHEWQKKVLTIRALTCVIKIQKRIFDKTYALFIG